jgi:osmotically-inducible protein OsmY
MRYEDRWHDRDRDERRDRSRSEDYGQAEFSDSGRGARRPWEETRFDRSDDRDHEREEHRAWRPFGETGPTRYGGRSGYDTGQHDLNDRYDHPDHRFGGRDRGYGSGRYGRDRDYGFGETGGRYSDSYQHERYGERDQWGSNPRSGAGNDARNWFDKASDKVQAFFGDDAAQRRSRWDEVRAGQHRGRGPKGYRRSDDRIREDVSDRLADDSWLDASDIEVRVEGAEVTLIGLVASRDDKRRAERLAEDVSGVDNVQNNLRVRREADRASSSFGDGSSTDTSLSGSTGAGRA